MIYIYTYVFCTCIFLFLFFKEYSDRIAFIRLYLLLRTSHNLAFLSLECFSCFWPWETAQILLKARVNISDLLAETSQLVFHLYRSSQTFFHVPFFILVIIEKNYSLKCYSAVLIKQKWSDFINKLNLKVISAVYFFLYNFLLLYVINILPYSHVWHTLEKLLSGVFWAPQRLKPEKPFLNAVLKAFEHSSTGCEAPWASSRQVNLPRNKFKEKKKKNQCKRVNVNVCSRESDPWRCVKTRVRTKLMTSSSAQPTLWREMAWQASF